jgi:hypothetical protein
MHSITPDGYPIQMILHDWPNAKILQANEAPMYTNTSSAIGEAE